MKLIFEIFAVFAVLAPAAVAITYYGFRRPAPRAARPDSGGLPPAAIASLCETGSAGLLSAVTLDLIRRGVVRVATPLEGGTDAGAATDPAAAVATTAVDIGMLRLDRSLTVDRSLTARLQPPERVALDLLFPESGEAGGEVVLADATLRLDADPVEVARAAARLRDAAAQTARAAGLGPRPLTGLRGLGVAFGLLAAVVGALFAWGSLPGLAVVFVVIGALIAAASVWKLPPLAPAAATLRDRCLAWRASLAGPARLAGGEALRDDELILALAVGGRAPGQAFAWLEGGAGAGAGAAAPAPADARLLRRQMHEHAGAWTGASARLSWLVLGVAVAALFATGLLVHAATIATPAPTSDRPLLMLSQGQVGEALIATLPPPRDDTQVAIVKVLDIADQQQRYRVATRTGSGTWTGLETSPVYTEVGDAVAALRARYGDLSFGLWYAADAFPSTDEYLTH